MTTEVDLAEAQAHLPDLVERAVNGEEIIIGDRGMARVRLVPVKEQQPPRQLGRLKGQIWLGPDFDRDLTDHFEDL